MSDGLSLASPFHSVGEAHCPVFLFLGNGSPQPSTSATSPTIKEEGQETDPPPGSEGSSSAYIVGEMGRQEQGCGAL